MSTQLDPVTGLPMLAVPDVISQIPLGVQVVPWDDLKATDRPMQGPAYPNDMINTLAYVSGESTTQPGTMHAATMTDDRRLRVDTGGGGGGGSIQPQNYFPYMVLDDFDMQFGGDTDHSFWFPPLPTKLFGYEYGFTYNGTLGVENYFDIEFHRTDGTYVTTFLHSSFLPQAAVGGNFTFSRNSVVMLPQPWDMSALLNFNTGMFVRYRCNVGEIGGYFNTWAAL